MEQTPTYKLLKPAPNDYVDIGVFNQNMDLIDSELGTKYDPDNKPTAVDVGAAPAVEDADRPGCYYRMVDGVKEWINPPMVIGVEYRTTERYNGKPVYVKAVDCGALLNATQKSTAHGIANYDAFLSVTGYASSSNASDRLCLPLVNGNLSSAVFVSAINANIKTSCIGDFSSWPNHTVILKYTKTTD